LGNLRYESRRDGDIAPYLCNRLDPAHNHQNYASNMRHLFGHRMKSFLVTIVLLSMARWGWAEPKMEMHRIQATTKDPSGWYLAASTHGAFSVLIPIPFNDFTVIDDDPKFGKIKGHIVGAKSAEGIKFSAAEAPIIVGKTPTNLASLPQQFSKSGNTVSDIDNSLFAGYPSVSFSVKGPSSGAYMRHVKTPKSLIVLVLEYPKEQAKAAEGLRSTFLSSLKINKTEQDGASPDRVGILDRAETNRTSSGDSRR